MNRWNIPALLVKEVTSRDQCCIYCRVVFGSSGKPEAKQLGNT
jgi:hypothetical protein